MAFDKTDPTTLAYTGVTNSSAVAAPFAASGDVELLVTSNVLASLDDGRLATDGKVTLTRPASAHIALALRPDPLPGKSMVANAARANRLPNDVEVVQAAADSDALIDDDLLSLISQNPLR
jgi:hypothetical protein